MMSIKLSVLIIVIFLSIQCGYSKNDSNILRLSRPLKTKIDTKLLENDSNDTDNIQEVQKPKGHRLVLFSKNNPELDWKTYINKNVGKNDQVPRDLDLDFMNNKLETNGNSIQWLSDLYDPLKWIRVPGKLNDNCRNHMEIFLHGLKDGKLWAAKSK